MRRCIWKFVFLANPFLQMEQKKGFSPVCIRKWDCKFVLRENFLPQTLQSNGRSPVCVSMCAWRLVLRVKHLPHTWQANGLDIVEWSSIFCDFHWNLQMYQIQTLIPKSTSSMNIWKQKRIKIMTEPEKTFISVTLPERGYKLRNG